jgi:hypothetical protein
LYSLFTLLSITSRNPVQQWLRILAYALFGVDRRGPRPARQSAASRLLPRPDLDLADEDSRLHPKTDYAVIEKRDIEEGDLRGFSHQHR